MTTQQKLLFKASEPELIRRKKQLRRYNPLIANARRRALRAVVLRQLISANMMKMTILHLRNEQRALLAAVRNRQKR